jgi:hypothetical protein
MRPNTHEKTLREIAVALDVPPDRLAYFVECHPNPTVATVLELADRPPVDDETRDRIAEWLADDGDETPDETGADDARGLAFHRGGDADA